MRSKVSILTLLVSSMTAACGVRSSDAQLSSVDTSSARQVIEISCATPLSAYKEGNPYYSVFVLEPTSGASSRRESQLRVYHAGAKTSTQLPVDAPVTSAEVKTGVRANGTVELLNAAGQVVGVLSYEDKVPANREQAIEVKGTLTLKDQAPLVLNCWLDASGIL